MNLPEVKKKRKLVIIGGGFAGLELAKRLANDLYEVTMIDKNNYHTFQPLLYQVATGGLEPDSIAYPIRKIFSGNKSFHFRVGEAFKVDTVNQILFTSFGEVP